MKQSRIVKVATACLAVGLIVASLAGCAQQKSTVVPGPVSNPTYVDVMGLASTPTKVVVSYPTQSINLGNDDYIANPQFIDGVVYSYGSHSESDRYWIELTAWYQATGKKLWSVKTAWNSSPPWHMSTLFSDGEHLFTVWGADGSNESLVCLDPTTGRLIWNNTAIAASPYTFVVDGHSDITLHVDGAAGKADRLYVVGHETERGTAEGVERIRNVGVWCFDARTGKVLGRFDLPQTASNSSSCSMVCDNTTLYAYVSIDYRQSFTSFLLAYDVISGKKLWEKKLNDECGGNLVKQGNNLIFRRGAFLEVWNIGDSGPTETWAHKLEARAESGLYSDFAVDSTHVYLDGKGETAYALDLVTGKEVWHQQLHVRYQRPDKSDPNKRYDYEPNMTLTATKNVLYVDDGGGQINALDPAGGKILWSKRFSKIEWHQTYVANLFIADYQDKRIVIITSDGKVSVWE